MGNILFPGNCLSVFPEIVFVFVNLFPPVFQFFPILIKIEMSVFIMDKSLQYRFGISVEGTTGVSVGISEEISVESFAGSSVFRSAAWIAIRPETMVNVRVNNNIPRENK